MEADGATRSPVRGLMRQPCAASTSWSQPAAACARASGRLQRCRHSRDQHRDQRRQRELHSYYGRVRQRVPHRYSAPPGFRRLESSLSPLLISGSIGTRLHTFHTRA